MKEILLIIQLFFANAPEQFRAELPTTSLEECFQLAATVMEIREWRGRPVISVGAGCYQHLEEERKS